MGWWDYGIMGGDTPLDMQARFDEKFGFVDEEYDPVTPAVLPTGAQVEDFMRNEQPDWCYNLGYENIWPQVIGYLVIDHKLEMTDAVRAAAIKGAQDEIDSIQKDNLDGWNSPCERTERLKEFIAVVEVYDGTQEAPESKGLFEAMAEAL
jgi:hypothetical protein